jgi:hypothetical protein
VLLMVNYLGATDTPCDGDQAAELFIAAIGPEIRPVVQQRTEFYRLDLLQASPTP